MYFYKFGEIILFENLILLLFSSYPSICTYKVKKHNSGTKKSDVWLDRDSICMHA